MPPGDGSHLGSTARSKWIEFAAVGGVSVLVGLATHDFWRIDACLDAGGAWDGDVGRCVGGGPALSLPPAFPAWVFAAFSGAAVAVLLVAGGGVWAMLRGQWPVARRRGKVSALVSVALFAATMGLATYAAWHEPSGEVSKAARLGRTISDFMNATPALYLGGPLGFVTWAAGWLGARRQARRPG